MWMKIKKKWKLIKRTNKILLVFTFTLFREFKFIFVIIIKWSNNKKGKKLSSLYLSQFYFLYKSFDLLKIIKSLWHLIAFFPVLDVLFISFGVLYYPRMSANPIQRYSLSWNFLEKLKHIQKIRPFYFSPTLCYSNFTAPVR